MKPDSSVDVIPVFSEKGDATIGGQTVGVGEFVHLEEGVQVEGDFFCLLLLRQRKGAQLSG